jgi:ABC-type transport system involved in multi-copper enzyme maturation permease subunit
MLRLLNIEFQKLRYSKSARVLSIIYFILITFIALIASIEFNFGNVNFRIADQGIFNFPFIWHFNTYIAALLKLFLAIVIVSMMSNEYSNRTLKQNLIDGLSKKEFVLSKFYTVLVFALISTVFVFLVSVILGTFFFRLYRV